MRSKLKLHSDEWEFKFPMGETEEAITALCWEWEFTREINRKNGTALRGTNAWGERFDHKKDIPFFKAVPTTELASPTKELASIWEKVESCWFDIGALGVHDVGIFSSVLNRNPFHGWERENRQTLHRKDAEGRIIETVKSFPIRWEVPDKSILREMRLWLEYHRKSGFPGGKVAKARRQKPWVQICQTELRELAIYRAWKHHQGRVREFQNYITSPYYEEASNYSHAVKRTRQRLQRLLRCVEKCEEDGLRFLF